MKKTQLLPACWQKVGVNINPLKAELQASINRIAKSNWYWWRITISRDLNNLLNVTEKLRLNCKIILLPQNYSY